jgi:hypothetical protein
VNSFARFDEKSLVKSNVGASQLVENAPSQANRMIARGKIGCMQQREDLRHDDEAVSKPSLVTDQMQR